MTDWTRGNPPEFPRPYERLSFSELQEIARSLPDDYRLSTRLNWENNIVHAYAELGYRFCGTLDVIE